MQPRFAYLAPGAALAGLVAFHFILDSQGCPIDAGLCALLAQVQIVRGGTAHYRFGSHEISLAPGTWLMGASDTAGRLSAPPGVTILGAGLTPAGWTAISGGLALANRSMAWTFDGDDALAAACDAAADPGAMVALLDVTLAARCSGVAPDPLIAIIDAWIISDGVADIDALARSLALSRRSLERLTLRTHGATPKRLSAKYRALKAAARLAVGEVHDWRAAAAPGAFADQAHFIRDFRRYVGMTPGQFMADEMLFARRLIRGQWAPGREIGIAIWA